MDLHTITEQAYKNGYEAGYQKAKNEITKEIFRKINSVFREYYNKCSRETKFELLKPLHQVECFIINEIWHEINKFKGYIYEKRNES